MSQTFLRKVKTMFSSDADAPALPDISTGTALVG